MKPLLNAVLKASAEAEMPLWKELWLYFYDTYYGNSVYYPNLGVDTAAMKNIKNLILAFCIGLSIAAFGAVYNKRVLGKFVRKLLKEECLSPESAKTLGELGFSRNIFVKLSLIFGTTLRRVVHCVEAEEWEEARKNAAGSKVVEFLLPEKRYRNNFSTDRFYIPESYKYTAEIRFAKKGNSLLSLALTAVLGIVAVVLIFKFAPSLLSMIDEFIGSVAAN